MDIHSGDEFNQTIAEFINRNSIIDSCSPDIQLTFLSPSEFWGCFAPPPPPDNEYWVSCPELREIKFRVFAPSIEWAKMKAAEILLVGESFIECEKIKEAKNADSAQE